MTGKEQEDATFGSIISRYEALEKMNKKALEGGGEEKISIQHQKGKLTARERIDFLLDKGSFHEIGKFVTHRSVEFGLDKTKIPGDGVVTGYGTIDARMVYVYAQDFTVFGGSLSEAHAEKIVKLMDLAMKNGAPLIGISDSGGARIQEGVDSLGGYANIFYRNVMLSGVVPQISVIMGPCAGGAVYSPAMTDFIFMVEGSAYMFVTGPKVVKTVTHEEVTAEELGGARTHSFKSGVTHFSEENDFVCLSKVKALFGYIPQNCEDLPSSKESIYSGKAADLDRILPENPESPYDIKEVINLIVDTATFFEVQENFAANIVVGFARLSGRSIGVVANQPSVLAGVLDIHASQKGARFVRFCDCFNIPLLVFEDVPGFLPGTKQEWNAIITNGAKLLYAFCEATVPRVTVIIRKAYGGAYDVMNSKHIGADMNFAWPTAEIAVMGARGASEIIFKREIEQAPDSEAELARYEKLYNEKFANPYIAASRGYIDEVIMPHQTREKVIAAFDMLRYKVDKLPKKKHGNIPL